jgi:hypothetical protein
MHPFRHSLLALLLPLTFATPALADGDWTGKDVFVKRAGVKMGCTDAGGEQVYLVELSWVNHRVIKDEGGWLKVKQNRDVGWIQKDDAIVADEAVDFFTDRIQANPLDARAFACRAVSRLYRGEVLRYYAFFRATCPDADFRDATQAVEMAKKACELLPNGWKNGAYLSVLAAALAEAGDFDEAVRRQQEALADSKLETSDRGEYEARLKLYREKKAFRDE